MSKPADQTLPEGMHSITPHLVCANALEAIEFYKKAFNALVQVCLKAKNGMLVHAGLRIGDSMIMLAEECPQWQSFGPLTLKGSPVTIHLMVPDVDAAIAQAEAAGAKITMPAADMFWGDRYGQVVDPSGHRWSIATRLRQMSPEEMEKAMNCAFPE